MSVRNRLLLGVLVFLGASTLAIAVLLHLFNAEVGDVLGRSVQSSAAAMSDDIDRALFHQIEALQTLVVTHAPLREALRDSAAELERAASGVGSVQDVLAQRDREWVDSTPEGQRRKEEILARPVSEMLREHQTFYRERYDFQLLGEIFVTDRYGANVAQTTVTSDYLQSDEDWWRNARDQGLAVGDPVWDESAGVLAVEVSLRIDDSAGNLAGVLKAAIALDEILRVVQDSRKDLGIQSSAVEVVTATGQRMLVDGDTTLVPEESEAVLIPEGGTGAARTGYRHLDASGSRPAVLMGWGSSRGYRDLKGTGWMVQVFLDSGEVLGPVHRLRSSLLILGSIALLFAVGVSFLIGRTITGPINRVVQAAGRLAEGDYSFEVRGSARGEMGRLQNGLRRVVENGRTALRGVVLAASRIRGAASELAGVSEEISEGAQVQLAGSGRTSTAMDEVAASTEQLAASAERVSHLVHDVSSSIEEMARSNEHVARHSESLARAMDRTSENLGGMAASIQQVADTARQAKDDSETAVAEARAGGEAVDRVIGGIAKVSETLDLGLEVMGKLDRTHTEVQRRTRLIDDLCDETGLLAINAAIEAANAGEHGRTFAVVAADMRRLSERSAEAASEIAEVLEQVAGDVSRALEVTATGAQEAREGETLAERAGQALRRIGEAVEGTRQRMVEISDSTEEQARASGEALRAIEEVRSLSLRMEEATREQAQGSQRITEAVGGIRDLVEEVSAATGSQTRESERIARSLAEIHQVGQQHAETVIHIIGISQELKEQVAELERVAGFFRLSEDGQDGGQESGDLPGRQRGQEDEEGRTARPRLAPALSTAPISAAPAARTSGSV